MLRAILIHKNLNENNQLFSEEYLFVDFENEEIENRLSSGGYSENGYDTTSFVGLGIINNPPKSEELEWSTDEQQTKVKISKLIRELEVSHTIGMSIDDMIEKLQKLSAIDKKVCILKSDGERKDSASYAGICPVCQSHIQLSMYSGEGKVSGASPDTANSKTQTVKIDFKYLKKAILKFDAKSVYQQAAIIMLRQVFKDYKEK